MKALIRNEGETVTEDMDIPCIDWSTGWPLTDPKWTGGPYQLVQNYVPPVDNALETYEIVEPAPEPEQEAAPPEDEPIIINGVAYTKEQLRQMIGE